MKLKQKVLWFSGAAILLGLDMFSKFLALKYLSKPFEVIPGVLKLAFSQNTGVAFSIPIPNATMVIATPILIALIAWFLKRHIDFRSKIAKATLILIIAGGTGNFIDRLARGAVTDFLDFSFWPSFNLADSYLTIAAFLLIAFYGKITITEYGRHKSSN